MTRKHYIRLARIIKDNTMNDTQPIKFSVSKSLLNKDSFVDILCDMLYEDNNLFNRQRFIDACND